MNFDPGAPTYDGLPIGQCTRPTPHHGTIFCAYDGPARSEGRFQVWDAACECGWRDEDLTTWAYAYWALHRHQTEETA